MWRKIEGKGIKILQDKFDNFISTEFKYDEDLSYGAVGLFLSMGGAFYLLINGFDSLIGLVLSIIFILAGVVLIAVQVSVHKKWKSLKQLSGKGRAEYAEGVLKGRYSKLKYYETEMFGMTVKRAGSGRNYFAKVNIYGRRIKIPCTKEVYKKLKRGDTVYVVDLIGKQAQYPRFCYAVADIENYIGCVYMNMNEMLEDLKKTMKQLDNLKTFRFAKLTGDIDSVSKMPYYQQEKDKLELYARELSEMRNAKIYCENEDNISSFIFQKELNEIKKIDTHLDDIIYRNILETENMIHDILSHNSDF